MGSGATTPKVWGYRPGGSHLGSFLTRQLFPVTTGWAYGSLGIGPMDEPNVHRSRLNSGSGPVVDKTYTLWMMIMNAHFSLLLIFVKICKFILYYILCFVVLLTELLNSPPYPYNSFQMALHIIILIAGVPIGVATYDNSRFWPIDADQWVYVCFDSPWS